MTTEEKRQWAQGMLVHCMTSMKETLIAEGDVLMQVHLIYPDGGVEIIPIPFRSEAEKVAVRRQIRRRALGRGARAVVHMSDAWFAAVEPGDPNQRATSLDDFTGPPVCERPNRREALMVAVFMPGLQALETCLYRRTPEGIVWEGSAPAHVAVDSYWNPWRMHV